MRLDTEKLAITYFEDFLLELRLEGSESLAELIFLSWTFSDDESRFLKILLPPCYYF